MSSGISGVYDAQSKVLTVSFRNGTYPLPNVPASVAAGFASAASKGKYWNKYLRDKY
jgi:hypothetical protein